MEASNDTTGEPFQQESMTQIQQQQPQQQQQQQSLVDRMNRRLSPSSSPTTLPSIDQASSTHKHAYSTSTTSERGTATTLASLPTLALNNPSLGLSFSSLGGGGSGAASSGNISSNNERSAVVLALFGPSVGPCVGDFSTSYNRVNGRLYASTKAILFYSNLFGFERRLCLQLSDVTDIDFFRSTSIRVSMVDCEDYIFKRIQDRDYVLSILKELLYREQQLQPSSSTGTMMRLPIISNHTPASISSSSSTTSSGPTTTGAFKFRRPGMSGLRRGRMMSNDEMTNRKTTRTLMSPSSLLPMSSSSNHNSSHSERRSRPHLSSDISEPEHASPSTSMRRRSKSVPSIFPPLLTDESGGGDDSQLGDSFNGDLPMTPTIIQRKGIVPFEGLEHSEESENYDDDDIVNPSEAGSLEAEYNNGANMPSLAVIRSVWDRLKEPLEEVHVESVAFSCSLDSYFRLFLADQASHSVDKYQSDQIGDSEIVTTPWKDEDSDAANLPPGMVKIRTFQFFHPLKNSLGPSKAKTTRHQRLQRCGNLGMCWENTTSVEGIPAADCFRVEDRWVFEAVQVSDPTLENGGGLDSSRSCRQSSYHIKLTVTFRINFFKRSMLRSLIQKNVKQENRNWVKGYVSMVLRVLEAQTNGAVEAAPASTGTARTQTLAAAEQQRPAAIIPTTAEAFDMYHPQSSTVTDAAATAPLVAALAKDSSVAALLVCLILSVGCLSLLFLILQLWGVRQTLSLWQTEMGLLREQNQELIAAIQTLTIQYRTAFAASNSSSAPPR